MPNTSNRAGAMRDRFYSIFLLVFFVVSSSILIVIAVVLRFVTRPFDKRLRLLHLLTCFWGSLYIWVMPAWHVTVEGREKIRKDRTYVMVSNHASLVDILAVFRLFVHFKWVAKDELFRVPFVGWNMTLNRYIRIKRGDLEGIKHMMTASRAALAEGSSVFIFPEGTRSETHELRPFLSGAFTLAKAEQVAILPVVIHGSRDALPKGSLAAHGHHEIIVRVLDAIPYEEVAEVPTKRLAAQVRERIVNELREMDRSASRSDMGYAGSEG